MRSKKWAVCLLGLSLSPLSFAGDITFKNGDHLTGTVTVADENKLMIDSKVVGKLTVPLSDVASFTTDGPVKTTLTNGEVIKAPITTTANSTTAPATEAQTTTPPPAPAAPMSAAATQTIPRNEIAKIAPASLAQPWKGDVLIGATVQTGNTQASQVNASADATRRWENSRLTLAGQYIYGRTHDRSTGTSTTSSDFAQASANYNYFLTKKAYLYGLVQGQHDELADLTIRLSPSAGVGYQWHESPIWNFSTEAGIGWTYEEYSPGGTDEYVAARLAYHFDRKLTKTISFVHNFEYLPSLENVNQFVINTDAGVHADLTKTLFTEFKVQWTHNSRPAPGALQNDVRYLASLGWHF